MILSDDTGRRTVYDLTTMQRVEDVERVIGAVDPAPMGKDAVVSNDDGTTLIVAFNPANPTVIRNNGDMNEITTLFAPGSEPEGARLSSLSISSDGSWLQSWPESQDGTAMLIDLSGPNVVIVEVDVTEGVTIEGFVEGVDG